MQADGLPRDAAGLRRLKAMGFFRPPACDAGGAVQSALPAAWAETQAKRSGLLHDALVAMAGATSEDEVRALRPQARRLSGVQTDRQLRRRVRGDHALYVFDL